MEKGEGAGVGGRGRGGERNEGEEKEDCDGGEGRAQREENKGPKTRENTRERARARSVEQKVCEACSRTYLASPRLSPPLPPSRRGEDEKSVELTFIGKLQAAAFGTE